MLTPEQLLAELAKSRTELLLTIVGLIPVMAAIIYVLVKALATKITGTPTVVVEGESKALPITLVGIGESIGGLRQEVSTNAAKMDHIESTQQEVLASLVDHGHRLEANHVLAQSAVDTQAEVGAALQIYNGNQEQLTREFARQRGDWDTGHQELVSEVKGLGDKVDDLYRLKETAPERIAEEARRVALAAADERIDEKLAEHERNCARRRRAGEGSA